MPAAMLASALPRVDKPEASGVKKSNFLDTVGEVPVHRLGRCERTLADEHVKADLSGFKYG